MLGFLALTERPARPRESGLTHGPDKGGSLEQVRRCPDVVEGCAGIVKLGWPQR
jgi:hypothetical protein